MADSMERTYPYRAMFLYNRPRLSSNRNTDSDYVLSHNFVKFAVEKMEMWGFYNSYYHDRNATPGSNIFDELFETVDASRFIVVLCTRGFLIDAWGKYTSHATFAKLLNQNDSKRFIAIHIDLQDQQIPESFNTMIGISFSANWQNEYEEWDKFKNLLVNVNQPVPATVVPLIPADLTNRGNNQHFQATCVGIQAISGIETDGEHNESSDINRTIQSVNGNTTNINGVGLTSANNPPSIVIPTTGNNMEENISLTQKAKAVPSTSTTMQTPGIKAQSVQSKTTTMQTPGNREPLESAPTPNNSQNSSESNFKEIVGRDTSDDLFSSLNTNDVELDNSGQSFSNSPDNQVNTDSHKNEAENSQVCSQQPDHTRMSGCPKGDHSNYQHDSGYDAGLDLQPVLNNDQNTNGFNTESKEINRSNGNGGASLTNKHDEYESMDGPATNTQGASVLLSTMKRMVPDARSTMKNTVGTMLKSMIFVQKCDQSFL